MFSVTTAGVVVLCPGYNIWPNWDSKYTVMVQYFFVSTHTENIDLPLSLYGLRSTFYFLANLDHLLLIPVP
jgi:hypothetical protein